MVQNLKGVKVYTMNRKCCFCSCYLVTNPEETTKVTCFYVNHSGSQGVPGQGKKRAESKKKKKKTNVSKLV